MIQDLRLKAEGFRLRVNLDRGFHNDDFPDLDWAAQVLEVVRLDIVCAHASDQSRCTD